MEASTLQQLLDEHGPYTVLEKIGQGASAEVFLARRGGSAGFSKEVAIKVASSHVLDSEDALDRFRNEATLAASLRHENIVQVLGYHELDGHPTIEQDYIEGLTLRQVFATATKLGLRLPPVFSTRIIIEILDALEYLRTTTVVGMSSSGIIHRDLKPDNIFLSTRGVPKLGDFGVARLPDSQLTQRGSFMGTFSYLPLEAFQGKTASHAWDVWGCSVILWELLTQRRDLLPYGNVSSQEMFLTLRETLSNLEAPSPSSLMDDVPEGLSGVVLKALQRHPADRYATAGELRSQLLRVAPEAREDEARDLVRDVLSELAERRTGALPSTAHLTPLEPIRTHAPSEFEKPSSEIAILDPIPSAPPTLAPRAIHDTEDEDELEAEADPPSASPVERAPSSAPKVTRPPEGTSIPAETPAPTTRWPTWVVTSVLLLVTALLWALGPSSS